MNLALRPTRTDEARPTLMSAVVLALAVLLITGSLLQTTYRLSLPSDGWSYMRDPSGGGQGRLVLDRELTGEPSVLQHGDVLLAIQGLPIPEILAEVISFQGTRPPPAAWEAGRALRYTVQRGSEVLDIYVVLRYIPLADLTGSILRSFLLNPSLLPALLIALYVFWRRPGSNAARLLLLITTCFFASDGISQAVTGSNVLGPAELFHRDAYWGAQFFNTLIWPFLVAPIYVHLFFTFPVVKAPMQRYPRQSLAVLYGTMPLLTLGAWLLSRGDPVTFWSNWNTASLAIFFATLVTVAVAMGHTLLTVRDRTGQAQVRWVAAGALVTSLGAMMGPVLGALGLLGVSPLLDLVAYRLLFLGFPLALGIAILRYRLFEIDILLRRTLIYSILTGLLTAIYFVSVISLQQVLGAFTFETESEVVTVLSTLAIAALFVPLRGAVQRAIDKRFYRRKYNLAQIQAAFGEQVRDEVDLDRLNGQLVKVIRETMQPEHVSIWLTPPIPIREMPEDE